jgi:hypothetical protein
MTTFRGRDHKLDRSAFGRDAFGVGGGEDHRRFAAYGWDAMDLATGVETPS